MLVITRRRHESLVIGNETTVTVIDIRGDKVRLGITCPAHIPVYRQEVYDAIHGSWVCEPPRPRAAEEAAFLRGILADPGDEGLRLVFADWLEEQGDPLGEWIRLQCAVAQLPANDPRCRELNRRLHALWDTHGSSWKASLPEVLWTAPVAFLAR